ncbi:PspC domain-containing protein [Amycolatopsis acididurans]|nr:PspC domain-containing protein [Amycolatopsis acididurans]
MSGAADTTKPQGMGGFEETLKDFWVSRPRRPLSGRKVAGVAAGIGNRYGIDPVLVRVAFVAATVFGGVGLSVYLLCWLFFARVDDEVSPVEALFGRGRSSMPKAGTIIGLIALFPLSGWVFGNGWFDGGAIIGLALLVTAIYLLHRSRGHENRPIATTPAATTFAMAAPAAQTDDPLGAAPLAWDLPDPEPVVSAPPPVRPPRAPRRKSKIGIAVFGIALLVAGTGFALGTTGETWFSAQHIIGLVLGVLGIGMVAGAFAGGGRGLIWLAVPLSVAGVALTTVPVESYAGGFGDINATPATVAEVQPVYAHTAGDIHLDLTRLPADAVVGTRIHSGAGTTTVMVPSNADVTYTCHVRAGNVDCFGQATDGLRRPAVSGTDNGTDGPGGPRIQLDIEQGAGTVEVHRG